MIRLGVNIDHVATVRQARRASEPDPVAAAVLATLGGADGITTLWVKSLRTGSDQEFANTAGAAYPFWAPDSRQVGFFADAKLKKLEDGKSTNSNTASTKTIDLPNRGSLKN